jgi:hypothetical protein
LRQKRRFRNSIPQEGQKPDKVWGLEVELAFVLSVATAWRLIVVPPVRMGIDAI